MARSIPRTTCAMFPVTYTCYHYPRISELTFRIVTAVRTREATASIREARRNRLSRSCSLRIELPA
jgi:hypothetical protein